MSEYSYAAFLNANHAVIAAWYAATVRSEAFRQFEAKIGTNVFAAGFPGATLQSQ